MSTVKLHYFIFAIFVQILINNANGKAICPGECESFYPPCNYECGPAPAIVPIPQPIPVRIPQRENCQSVTIPNIIVALLPPTNKPARPRPVIRPPPVVLPLPQPYPFPGFPGCGDFGGAGFKRFEGCGCL